MPAMMAPVGAEWVAVEAVMVAVKRVMCCKIVSIVDARTGGAPRGAMMMAGMLQKC